MNRKLFIAFILVISSIGQALANSFHAQLVTKVASSSTGMGKVYAVDTTATYTGEFSTDSCAADVKNKSADQDIPFFAYAQPTDSSAYTFIGWSETDGGAIVSSDNPYTVNVKSASIASTVNYKYIYANFIEKVLCNITFVESTNGTYTITDGKQTITGGGTMNTNEKVFFTAQPAEGYKLMGWYRMNDKGEKSYFSFENNNSMIFTEDEKIGADFIKSEQPVFTIKGTDKLFTDLNEANESAGSGDVIVLTSDATLPKGNYNIKSGVTLLIPFDKDNTCYTADETPKSNLIPITPFPYCTLTLAEGAVIDVDGAISVSSNIYAITVSVLSSGGHVNGGYGIVKMTEGSQINVNDGGSLYAWGYVTGKGSVTAKSGSHIYEIFQLSDYRGGTCMNNMAESDYKVYPLNQYFIQNVEVPMTLCYGSEEKVMTGFSAEVKSLTTSPFTFIGTDGLFVPAEGTDIIKYLDTENDRQVYNVCGDASIGCIKMAMNGVIIDSKRFVLPLTNNLTVNIESGTLTVGNENGVALLPDAHLTIKPNAKMLIKDSKFYVYDEDEWGEYSGILFEDKPHEFYPVASPSVTFVRTTLNDATLDVQGTVELDNGILCTTKSGADICCTKGKGRIIFNNGEMVDTTYQVIQEADVITPYYIPIRVTPAQLKNAETAAEAYTQTDDVAQGTTFYFHQETGVWDSDEISTMLGESISSDAKCEEKIYDISGVKRKNLMSGMNIIKMSDGRIKKVFVK